MFKNIKFETNGFVPRCPFLFGSVSAVNGIAFPIAFPVRTLLLHTELKQKSFTRRSVPRIILTIIITDNLDNKEISVRTSSNVL